VERWKKFTEVMAMYDGFQSNRFSSEWRVTKAFKADRPPVYSFQSNRFSSEWRGGQIETVPVRQEVSNLIGSPASGE